MQIHAYTVTLEPSSTRQTFQILKSLKNPMWGVVAVAVIAALAIGAFTFSGVFKHNADGGTRLAISAVPDKPPQKIAELAVTSPAETTPPREAKEIDAKSKTNEDRSRQLAGEWKGSVTANGGDIYNVEISLLPGGKKEQSATLI